MHAEKCARMARAVQMYLIEHDYDFEWTADLAVVLLNTEQKKARVRIIPDVLFSP